MQRSEGGRVSKASMMERNVNLLESRVSMLAVSRR